MFCPEHEEGVESPTLIREQTQTNNYYFS